MELIDRQRVLEALDEVTKIKGYAYRELEEAIMSIPTEVAVKDCADCFGASFGDCENCDRVALSVRSKIGNKLADCVDNIDAQLEVLPERIKNDLGITERYKARRYRSVSFLQRLFKGGGAK